MLPLLFGDLAESMQSVSYISGRFTLQGFISLPPAGLKHKLSQYLYVNSRYVHAGQPGRLINKLQHSIMHKLLHSLNSAHQKQAPKESLLYPAFALQLLCPGDCFSVGSEIDKSVVEFSDWPTVLSIFQSGVVQTWHTVAPSKLMAEVLQDSAAARPNVMMLGISKLSSARSQTQKHAGLLSSLNASKQLSSHMHDHNQTEDCCPDAADIQLESPLTAAPSHKHDTRTAGMFGKRAADLTEQAVATAACACQDDILPAGTAAKPGITSAFAPRLQSSSKMKLPSAAQPAPHAADVHGISQTDTTSHVPPTAFKQQAVESHVTQSGHQREQAAPKHDTGPAEQPAGSSLYRSYSGPPFYSSHRRCAHTNPLHSLHSSRHCRTQLSRQQQNRPGAPAADLSQHVHVSQRHSSTMPGVSGHLNAAKSTILDDKYAAIKYGKFPSTAAAPQTLADITNKCGNVTKANSCTKVMRHLVHSSSSSQQKGPTIPTQTAQEDKRPPQVEQVHCSSTF